MTVPTPVEIKHIREALGLSVREFDAALGYATDGRMTMALEAGVRNGRPFEMTGPATKAMRYLQLIVLICDTIGDVAWKALPVSTVLPERLRQ